MTLDLGSPKCLCVCVGELGRESAPKSSSPTLCCDSIIFHLEVPQLSTNLTSASVWDILHSHCNLRKCLRPAPPTSSDIVDSQWTLKTVFRVNCICLRRMQRLSFFPKKKTLGGRFGYFLFFLFCGRGKGGGVRGGGRGGRFLIKNRGGGGEVPRRRRRRGKGRGNVYGERGGGS